MYFTLWRVLAHHCILWCSVKPKKPQGQKLFDHPVGTETKFQRKVLLFWRYPHIILMQIVAYMAKKRELYPFSLFRPVHQRVVTDRLTHCRSIQRPGIASRGKNWQRRFLVASGQKSIVSLSHSSRVIVGPDFFRIINRYYTNWRFWIDPPSVFPPCSLTQI